MMHSICQLTTVRNRTNMLDNLPRLPFPNGPIPLSMSAGALLNDDGLLQLDSDEYEDYQAPLTTKMNNETDSSLNDNNSTAKSSINQTLMSRLNVHKPNRYQRILLILHKWIRFAQLNQVPYCLTNLIVKYLFNLNYNPRSLRTFHQNKTDFLIFKLSNYRQCIENKPGKLVLTPDLSHLKSPYRFVSKHYKNGKPGIIASLERFRVGFGFHYALSEKKINPVLHKYHRLYYWEIEIIKISNNPRPLVNIGIASSNIDISHAKEPPYARVPLICGMSLQRGQLMYPEAPSKRLDELPQTGDRIGFLLDFISDKYNGCIRIFTNKSEIKYSWYSDTVLNKNASIDNVYNNEPFIKDLNTVTRMWGKIPPFSLLISEYKSDKMPKYRLKAYYKLKLVQKPSIPPKYNHLYQIYQKKCQICQKLHGQKFYVYSKSQKRSKFVKCRIKICPCHQCYVCSKRCQKIAWKNGHKDLCRLRKRSPR